MTWEDSVRKRSDPRKATYWLHYIAAPFLPSNKDLENKAKEYGFSKDLLILLDDESANSVTSPGIHGSQKYREYHFRVRRSLDKLKDKRIWWLTSESIDQAEENFVSLKGYDPMSNSCKLSSEILNLTDKIKPDLKEIENDVFIHIAHVFFPYELDFEEGKPFVRAFFMDEIDKTNYSLSRDLKSGFGTNRKFLSNSLVPQRPNYELNPSIYLPSIAKKLILHPGIAGQDRVDAEKEIDRHCLLNKFILGQMYNSIFNYLGIEEINLYAKSGSYARECLKYSDASVANPKIMRSEDSMSSKLREVHPTPLGVLENWLREAWTSSSYGIQRRLF